MTLHEFQERLIYLVFIGLFAQNIVLGCRSRTSRQDNYRQWASDRLSRPHINDDEQADVRDPPQDEYGQRASDSSFSRPDGNIDVKADVRDPPKCVHRVIHGSPPGDGQPNQAGSYSRISSKHSLGRVTEANHMPPYSCTRETRYDIGRGDLPALSMDYVDHRKAGTTINPDIRGLITSLLHGDNMVEALQEQIIADFPNRDLLRCYERGLLDMIKTHTTTFDNTGEPFLTQQQAAEMRQWLQRLINSKRK